MSKILFLSSISPNIKSGGSVVEQRDLDILSENFEVEKAEVYSSKRGKIQKILDLFFSPNPLLYTSKQVKMIKKKIKKSNAELVFIENSLLGNFAKYAKKHGKKVITYFHNCEYKLSLETRSKVWHKKIYKLENEALCFSDVKLFINARDKEDLKKLFKLNTIDGQVLPCSLRDTFHQNFQKWDDRYGLFVGSLFKPNEEAVKFIIDNLAADLDIPVKVVGFGFENFNYKTSDKVEIIGTADNLDEYISNAEYMIFPIFSGSGMKVKTLHSLMFGKKIFGTKEAFEGYLMNEHMVLCNDEQSFIQNINEYTSKENQKFYPEVRDFWFENYSIDKISKQLIQAIKQVFEN